MSLALNNWAQSNYLRVKLTRNYFSTKYIRNVLIYESIYMNGILISSIHHELSVMTNMNFVLDEAKSPCSETEVVLQSYITTCPPLTLVK